MEKKAYITAPYIPIYKPVVIKIELSEEMTFKLRILDIIHQRLHTYGINSRHQALALKIGVSEWQHQGAISIVGDRLEWSKKSIPGMSTPRLYELADPDCFDKIIIDILSSPSTRSAVYDKRKFFGFLAKGNIKSSNGKSNQKLSIRQQRRAARQKPRYKSDRLNYLRMHNSV